MVWKSEGLDQPPVFLFTVTESLIVADAEFWMRSATDLMDKDHIQSHLNVDPSSHPKMLLNPLRMTNLPNAPADIASVPGAYRFQSRIIRSENRAPRLSFRGTEH